MGYGSRPLKHFANFIVVIKGRAHEVDVLREGLAMALAEHAVIR
jgi:hypothetical protein